MDAMQAVLAQAEARLLDGPTEPVHVYDLRETALKRQADLMEKERMVRGRRDVGARARACAGRTARESGHVTHPPSTPPLLPRKSQVLRFKTYTMEAVLHSPIEKERARIMTFTYHIASSTLTVYEPPQEGSGLIQVRISRRAPTLPAHPRIHPRSRSPPREHPPPPPLPPAG